MQNNKVLNNAAWIIGCKIAQSLLNLLVGMLTARYLGPSGYGLVNYAASVVAFFIPLMRLGLHATLVQEIGGNPDNEGKTLGTALGMNLISGLLCVVAVIIFAFATSRGNQTAVIVCAIYSLTLLFQAAEMISYWFQAKLLSKYPSVAMLLAYGVVSAYKIWLLIAQRSICWFAWSNVIEHGLVSVLLLGIYFKQGRQKLAFSASYARKLLSVGKYYIISNLMITVFQQTDRLMLKLMLDEAATGYYSAAVTCAGIFGFLYAAIIDSCRPGILQARNASQEQYEKRMSCLYSVIFYLSLAQCLVTTVCAGGIVRILYGEEFLPAANALRICVWYVTYAYFGSVRSIWILCEGKHKFVWMIDVSGALLNVGLNWMLIPQWGICGAAMASLFTQFFMNFLLGFFFKPIRGNNRLLLRGLDPRYLAEARSAFES